MRFRLPIRFPRGSYSDPAIGATVGLTPIDIPSEIIGPPLTFRSEVAPDYPDWSKHTADEIAMGLLQRPLRTTPASDDPAGADVLLRWAHRLLRAVQRDGRVPDVAELHDWLDVFDRRDSSDDQMIQSFDHSDAEPRCGWG